MLLSLRVFCLFAAGTLALVTLAHAQDLPLKDMLIAGEDWKLVGEGYKFTEGPAVDNQGNIFFVDVPASKIYKIDVAKQNAISVFEEDSFRASGLMFGGDGRLYAACGGKRAIVAFDREGKPSVICDDVDVNDLCVTRDNAVYFTDPKNHQVWYVSPKGEKQVVDTGIEFPNGITLWPDQKTLVVADSAGAGQFVFRIEADGTLKFKQHYYTAQLPAGQTRSSCDGMTVDTVGRLYVASAVGLQVFDTQGRLSGIMTKPQQKFLSNVRFGGEKLDTLFVTCEDKVYCRRIKATGVRNSGPEVK